MELFSVGSLAATLAILGAVILVSALASGVIERTGFPQVAAFLGLGALLGPHGLGLMDFGLGSPSLRVIATLALVLVLFSDAVSVDVREARRHAKLALLVLGPGTLVSASLLALAAWAALGLPVAAAAILGAALASTDPVLLRGLLRRPDLPPPVRHALGLESGMNDGVLLPVVLLAILALEPGTPPDGAGWFGRIFDVLVLGPAAGALVGLVGVALLDRIRRRWGVRRDYESLYALGLAFTAFALAEQVGGSGFLAAFAAGLTAAALDVELCDCFHDYGQATAEMALLFTFVAFGTTTIWRAFDVIGGAALLFVGIALLVRPAVLLASLGSQDLDRRSRALIVWFGPRGLSSLLLVLLPVFAGVPGSERLFSIAALVVLASVAVHGGSPALWAYAFGRRARRAVGVPLGEPGPGSAVPAAGARVSSEGSVPADPGLLSVTELRELWRREEPVVLLDARKESAYGPSAFQARGAVRLSPDAAVARATELELPKEAWLVAYCD